MQQITKEAAEKRFKIIFEIGSGGFGRVVKAYDKESNELVAIKIVSNFVQSKQMMREFKFLSQTTNENIITFNGAFVVVDELWIVIEYCSFGNISKYKSVMDEELVLCIVRDTLNALIYIHKQKMIHSDVKPQNILFSSACDIKLADFGITRNMDSITINQSCEKDGSLLYMAPEMIRGKPINQSIDIWALGISAFEMMTGIPLGLSGFSSLDQYLTLKKPQWRDDFISLLRKMLSEDQNDRPSAQDLIEENIFKKLSPTWIIASEKLNRNHGLELFSDDE